jgi:Protein of unknown function (DUF3306)
MSSAENFVSRWSRLKREPEAAPQAVPAPDAPGMPDGAEGDATTIAETEIVVGDPEPAFDPASLPSIDSIEIDTDIRGFLQPRVPPELTRAALRRAWVSDPAIRDFIEIAENQWDFNDPTSIFGFGPMRATDNVPALLAQALGKLEDLAEKVVAAAKPSALAPLDEHANVQPEPPPPAQAALQAGSDEMPVTFVALGEPVAVLDEAPRRPRQHGGALPQ